jgi:hypothetical protein
VLEFNGERCVSSCGMVVGPCCANGTCAEGTQCIAALNAAAGDSGTDAGTADSSELDAVDAHAE